MDTYEYISGHFYENAGELPELSSSNACEGGN